MKKMIIMKNNEIIMKKIMKMNENEKWKIMIIIK